MNTTYKDAEPHKTGAARFAHVRQCRLILHGLQQGSHSCLAYLISWKNIQLSSVKRLRNATYTF